MHDSTTTFGPIMVRKSGLWREHLHLAVRRQYPAGAVLLRPGEYIEYLWFVEKGEVLVSHSLTPDTINGLFLMRENAMLGLLGFFNPAPAFATWVVVKPAVLHLFSREYIYNRLPNVLLLDLLEQFTTLSRSLSRRFVVHAGKAGEARVAQLILHLLEACPDESKNMRGNEGAFVPGITQAMAGYMLSLHAVTLNRILAGLRKRGILGRFTKQRLEIFNLRALRELASGALPPPA